MTETPAPATTPTEDQEAAARARLETWNRDALAQENEAAMMAAQEHLQRRVVALNVEVRHRDHRIAELEREVASLQDALTQASLPSSGDQDG